MNRRFFITALCVICIFTGCNSTKKTTEYTSPQEMLENGQVLKAQSLFEYKADINGKDANGNTVLHVVAKMPEDDDYLFTFFLSKGADPESKNDAGDTPLHIAIRNNNYKTAEAVVLAAARNKVPGDTIFSKDAKGVTALDLALNTDKKTYYRLFITEETGKIRDSEGQTLVHYFVKTKNLDGVKKCIEANHPISVKDNEGKTPLDLAFEEINDYASVEIAAALIQADADEVVTDFSYFQDAVAARNLNHRFDDGQTPLHLASIMGHNAIATYLLENNANTGAQDSTGATPLHEAIRYGNLEIAEMLLNAGANVNAKDNLGKTPILLIVPKKKAYDTYSLLIKYKADLNEKDMYGDTVLHIAAMLHVSTNVMRSLALNGAEVNAKNKEGVTPLEISIQQNDLSTIKMFTLYGADIHTKDTHGESPLSLALAASDNIFEATVTKTNINTQDSEGNTPLHIAILNNAPLGKIQHILSLSDDVNIRNRNGDSPLNLCVSKNWKEVGELLINKNADIFSTNNSNKSPLRTALESNNEIQNWLITAKTIQSVDGSGNTVLHYAAEWKLSKSISTLSIKGADINAKNANGETPLFSAAKSNDPVVIQTVLDSGGSIKERDHFGNTPLHTAVKYGHQESAEKLIALGININAQNSNGKSPLSEAASHGKYKIAKYLLINGADPNSCDTNGISVLVDTIQTQNIEMVKLLLKYGANPNLQEINGQNAFHAAAYTGKKEIISLIKAENVNPLSRDKQGNTPFSIVLKMDIGIIKEVLGNSYTITDSDGNSPVHILVKNNGSSDLLHTLINDGYPIDTRNADGYTPLNIAIEANNTKIAQILLENGANPFQTINKKGTNGVTIALDNANRDIIKLIAKYAGTMTDIQGNTILHYAAKNSSLDIIETIINLDTGSKTTKNISGVIPYTIAVRWNRPKDILNKLDPNSK